MSTAPPAQRFHVIIPALDEESSLPSVLDALAGLGNLNVIVVDNGSRDRTADVAAARGVKVVQEPRRGYGRACLAGLGVLAENPGSDIVAFLDADGSDDPGALHKLLDPIVRGESDFVLASRTLVAGEEGALTPVQHLGNRLACFLMACFWGVRYTDLAPFRALTLEALRSLNMQDTDFGWTVEMQIRAARNGLRVQEIPSRYHRRKAGRSKISGSFWGSTRAGVTILGVIVRELLTRKR